MELLSTTTVTLPYARRRGNFNRAYFQNQPASSRTINVQPLQQKKFLPTLRPEGLGSLPLICKSTVRPAWLDTAVPEPLRPYIMLARLNRTVGWWLQVWPSLWSAVLASKPGTLPDVRLMALLAGISILMHTSCCTLNDLHDIEFDKQVERSKKRPLASGELSPLQGWGFWCFQALLMTPLLLPLNKLSFILAAAQHVLWFCYPLMKRITYLPQAFLGIAINWGLLIGWAAVRGNFAELGAILPIFIGSVFWTLAYDTIYAHQDKVDDAKAGVKSTALLFGDKTLYWNLGFSAISIGCFFLGGFNAGLGWPYFAFMAAAAGQLLWQVLTADLSSPADCNSKFISNIYFGALVFTGMLLGRVVH